MNATPSVMAIVPLLLLLLVVGGLIYGIILWVRGGSGGGNGEMSCAGCGYAVRGLEALNCPECGADLRVVGIKRGQGAGRRGIGIGLTIACGGLLLLGCLSSVFFVSVQRSQPIQVIPTPNTPTSAPAPATPVGPGSSDGEDIDSPEDENPF